MQFAEIGVKLSGYLFLRADTVRLERGREKTRLGLTAVIFYSIR